jgi:hypothetical protein
MFDTKNLTDLTGLTKRDCAKACNADCCVITELPNCAHPCMGGVQHALKSSAILARYAVACKAIGVRNIHEIMEGIAS